MRNKPFGSRTDSLDQNNATTTTSSEALEGTSLEGEVDSNGVYSLPDPLPLKREIVVPETNTSSFNQLDIQYDSETGSLNDLMKAHRERWKKIRSNWKERSHSNQARYAESIKKIREMFS